MKCAKMSTVRINILVIAAFIALICVGILILIGALLLGGNEKVEKAEFIVGALVGLLSSGITGLAGLGTTLINETTNPKNGSD